jgi:hypothetical protein
MLHSRPGSFCIILLPSLRLLFNSDGEYKTGSGIWKDGIAETLTQIRIFTKTVIFDLKENGISLRKLNQK